MSLLKEWRDMAYSTTTDKSVLKKLWDDYFLREKEIYTQLLSSPDEVVEGTVKELAEKYDLDIMRMTGFLDGIQESLKTPNDIENMTEDTHVSLEFDKEKLYKNMVGAEAEWLYGLKQWDDIFTKEEQERLYKEQKRSRTFVREGKKIGMNDPCPCGSGKKYKNCCGRPGASGAEAAAGNKSKE